MNIAELSMQFGLLILAASAAFAISNGSFYLFSGRYMDLSWGQYFSRIARYYPFYVGSALIYTVAGLSIVKLLTVLSDTRPKYEEFDRRN